MERVLTESELDTILKSSQKSLNKIAIKFDWDMERREIVRDLINHFSDLFQQCLNKKYDLK